MGAQHWHKGARRDRLNSGGIVLGPQRKNHSKVKDPKEKQRRGKEGSLMSGRCLEH